MYTSYIGKKFLKLYREKENKRDDYSAEQFFDEFFFPLFFTEKNHLMHVSNSPLFQPKTSEEDLKKYGSKLMAQYNNLKIGIAAGRPNMAVYVGYGAKDIEGTTSGQITSMDFKIDSEEMYASWIGEAFSIGVNGALNMLIDESEILIALFEGWKYYRKYLEQTPKLKDKQIETWNGLWLCHSFSKNYDHNNPMSNLQITLRDTEGKLSIPTQEWSLVIFALAKHYPNKVMTAYAYSLSQMNTTLGFINLFLPEVRRLYELRDKIFLDKSQSILTDKEIEQLEPHFGFKNACKMGTIGLKALEPKQLKDFKFTDNDSFLFYKLYKLWIIAMLNKTELLKLANELAKTLIDSESQSNRGKTTTSQNTKDLLETKSKKAFIECLTANINASNKEIFNSVYVQVWNMPSDNFPLFITLVRFEHAYQSIN